ncbi:MIOREX complex component 2 [Monosporozyma unispora]|nr:hypothetical protein C6P44_003495 [Kazachstania unispora]
MNTTGLGRKLVVFGGNGFLGKRICQIALQSGIFKSIIALSRSGKQPSPTDGNRDRYPHDWMKKIEWEKADIFDPKSYEHHLTDTTDVVHSIGVLLESSSYKSIVNGGKNVTSNVDPTYKKINTESALTLGRTFQNVLQQRSTNATNFNPLSSTLTYISADNWSPVIPNGYIESKREAEWQLSHLEPELFRSIFMRPGIMYDENSRQSFNVRNGIVDVLSVLNCTNKLLFQKRFETVNNLIRPPVSTQQVARSLISKIEDAKFTGIVTLDQILE